MRLGEMTKGDFRLARQSSSVLRHLGKVLGSHSHLR